MSDFSFAVQAAVFAALTAASPAIASGRIYDDPPPDAAFPYVEIGEGQTIPDDASGDGGVAETIDLHVWSTYRGQKEAKEIAARIYDTLHGVALTVPGRASALAWVRTRRIFRDPDGVTRHAVVSVEVIHRS